MRALARKASCLATRARRPALLVVIGLEASVLIFALAPREDDYESFLLEPVFEFVYGSLVLTPLFAPLCIPGAVALTAVLRWLERRRASSMRCFVTSVALSPLLGAPIFALFALEPGAPGFADWVLLVIPGSVFASGSALWDAHARRVRGG